jgi:hypothetical protein
MEITTFHKLILFESSGTKDILLGLSEDLLSSSGPVAPVSLYSGTLGVGFIPYFIHQKQVVSFWNMVVLLS